MKRLVIALHREAINTRVVGGFLRVEFGIDPSNGLIPHLRAYMAQGLVPCKPWPRCAPADPAAQAQRLAAQEAFLAA